MPHATRQRGVLPKPQELLDLHSVAATAFGVLRALFHVQPTHTLDLTDIDASRHQLQDPVEVAALAMRKLQALRLLATKDVRTSSDVVMGVLAELYRHFDEVVSRPEGLGGPKPTERGLLVDGSKQLRRAAMAVQRATGGQVVEMQ